VHRGCLEPCLVAHWRAAMNQKRTWMMALPKDQAPTTRGRSASPQPVVRDILHLASLPDPLEFREISLMRAVDLTDPTLPRRKFDAGEATVTRDRTPMSSTTARRLVAAVQPAESVPEYVAERLAACDSCGKAELRFGYHTDSNLDLCLDCFDKIHSDRTAEASALAERLKVVPGKTQFVEFCPRRN